MTTEFHTIKLEDVAKLLPIENACHSHPWSEKLFSSCIGGSYFGEYIQVDGDVVGFYIAQCIVDEATLMDICVHPSQQGQGFGKSLMKAFLKQTKKRCCQQLFLEVRASNIAAQMLYINQGFSESGRRTGYYPSTKGFGYEDAIVMSKRL